MKKTAQFKEILKSNQLEYLMEAHNGLSAIIVEETGFKGIWASGLSISAALGVRDNNEASWTQVLEVVEFMSDATSIPILLDGDTGYGNFNNMRRLVRKLEQRGAAAVCIEDKIFPKTNSFINGEKQALADMDEFVGKIKAAKDAQNDPDFSLIARLEAFISGWGIDEMMRRANAYYEAGADALLIHSKKSTPEQVLAFAENWNRPCPLVIVPTMYYSTPTEVFSKAGISTIIWANHNVRSSITAMQKTCRQIFEEQSLLNVEDKIVSVRDIFRLQKSDELAQAEERYLPKSNDRYGCIILAASQGVALGTITKDKPKTMIPISGTPILHKLIAQLRQTHIKDITVVRGYRKEEVFAPGVSFIDNDEYQATGELTSLSKAMDVKSGGLIIAFGDILFRKYILFDLLNNENDISIVVDAAWQDREYLPHDYADYVTTSKPYSLEYSEEQVFLTRMHPDIPSDKIHGEWIGLMKTTSKGTEIIKSTVNDLKNKSSFSQLRFKDLFQEVLNQGYEIHVTYITGHWLDVDNLKDLERAQEF